MGVVFPSVLQPLTGRECVPGLPTGIQGEIISLCHRELVSERQQYIQVVVRWSGRIVGEWDTLGRWTLFFR